MFIGSSRIKKKVRRKKLYTANVRPQANDNWPFSFVLLFLKTLHLVVGCYNMGIRDSVTITKTVERLLLLIPI